MLAESLDVGGHRVDLAFLVRIVAEGDGPTLVMKASGHAASGDSSCPISVSVLQGGRVVKPGGQQRRRQCDDDVVLAYEWKVPLDGEGARIATAKVHMPVRTLEQVRFEPCATAGTRVELSLTAPARFACGEQKGVGGRAKWSSDNVGNPAMTAVLRASLCRHLTHELFFPGDASALRRALSFVGVRLVDVKPNASPAAPRKRTLVASDCRQKRRLSVKTRLVFDTPEKLPLLPLCEVATPARSHGEATSPKDTPRSTQGPAAGTPRAEPDDVELSCEFCGSAADETDGGELISCARCAITFCSGCSSQHSNCRRKSVASDRRHSAVSPRT